MFLKSERKSKNMKNLAEKKKEIVRTNRSVELKSYEH